MIYKDVTGFSHGQSVSVYYLKEKIAAQSRSLPIVSGHAGRSACFFDEISLCPYDNTADMIVYYPTEHANFLKYRIDPKEMDLIQNVIYFGRDCLVARALQLLFKIKTLIHYNNSSGTFATMDQVLVNRFLSRRYFSHDNARNILVFTHYLKFDLQLKMSD